MDRRTVNERRRIEARRRLRRRKQIFNSVLFFAGTLVAILLCIYLAVSVYYQNHFFKGTTLNGVDISKMTVSEAESYFEDEIRYYVLKLVERGNVTELITADDIDLEVVFVNNQTIADVKEKQNPYLWPFESDETYEITIERSYDSDKLLEEIANLVCNNYTEEEMEPTNATVSYDGEKFVIEEGNPGMYLDSDLLSKFIIQYVDSGYETLNLNEAGIYLINSDTQSNDLTELENELNGYLTSVINYTLDDTVITLDKDTFAQWLTIDEDYSVTFDRELIHDWIDDTFSLYESYGKIRTFTTHSGSNVRISGGDYGWWIDDTSEIDMIIENIKSGDVVTRDLNYYQKAASHGTLDIGDTYVEISISEQKLYVFKDGSLQFSCDCITGKSGYSTLKGVYRLRVKLRNFTFSRTYFTKTVSYWMVYYGNTVDTNVGIMDAVWYSDSDFGGTTYVNNGSYGSIYVSSSSAASIYSLIPVDTAIVIY